MVFIGVCNTSPVPQFLLDGTEFLGVELLGGVGVVGVGVDLGIPYPHPWLAASAHLGVGTGAIPKLGSPVGTVFVGPSLQGDLNFEWPWSVPHETQGWAATGMDRSSLPHSHK